MCRSGWLAPKSLPGVSATCASAKIFRDKSKLLALSFDLSRKILAEAHVALTPGKDFGANHPERHIRIAYTNKIPRLAEAIERIRRVL